MQRSLSSALLPLASALERLLAGREPVAPVEVPLAEARGAVSAAEVVSPVDVPKGPTAMRDGWAVSYSAVIGASQTSPVLLPRAPSWVEAGDGLPASADTVLPPDALEAGTEREVIADAAPGEGAVVPGAALAAGRPIIGAGERVGPLHLLALACAGVTEIAVRVPRIAILATGGERDRRALAPALAGMIAAGGAAAVTVGPAPDDLSGLAEAIGAAATGADAVFVLGGTGMGRQDGSAVALSRAGTLAAHGISLRPGESAGFGDVGGRAGLLLPGRPEAAIATFLALGKPLLRRLAGHCSVSEATLLPLTRKISSAIGMSEVVFVRGGAGGIEPLGSLDVPLHRLIEADGWVLVPPEREGYPEGTAVEMMSL